MKNVRDEFRLTIVVARKRFERFNKKWCLYRVYRQVGNPVRVSWIAAEAEIRFTEIEQIRVLADKLLFRMECERDFAALQVTE